MHAIWEAFREARGPGWAILACGALGGLAALAALVTVSFRPRAALRLAVAAIALGTLAEGVGGVAVLYGRSATDASLVGQDLRRVERHRARRDGYLEARVLAKLGLFCAAFPLLAGAALGLLAARRRAVAEAPPPDPELPLPPRARLAWPVSMTVAGALSASFAYAAWVEPVPARDPRVEVTTRRLLERLDEVKRAQDGEALAVFCERLEAELDAREDSLDRARVPGLPAAARACVEARIQQAAVLSSLAQVLRGLEAIAGSPLLELDPASKRLLDADIEEVRQM